MTLAPASLTFGLAYARATVLAAAILVVAGAAWIVSLSTLSSQYQGSLPGWAKARGMAYYLVVFQGGGAIGSAAFGVVAQRAGLTDALVLSGALPAVAAVAVTRGHRRPAQLWPTACETVKGRLRPPTWLPGGQGPIRR